MDKTTDIVHPTQWKKFILAQFWIFITILLVFVLGNRFIPASSSYSSVPENMLVEPGLFSTPTATATGTRQPTATRTPTRSSTNTPTRSSIPPTTILVSGHSVNLRKGPGTNFSSIRKFKYAEQLLLLGRLSDNSWLYVKAPDGQEGWIKMSWVDLAEVNLNNEFPVKTPSPALPETILVAGGRVNLRAGPGTYFSSIRMLKYDEQVLLLGRFSDNSWLYVKTSDSQEGWIKMSWVNLAGVNLNQDTYPFRTSPPTETSTPVVLTGIDDHWIDIDLSEQMLRAYDGTELINSFLVSTGISIYPTEKGRYRIYAKFPKYTMTGSDYHLPDVPFTMFYSGDFAIHGTYWHHNFGTRMSHGCVNMDTKEAEWLYNFSSVGTVVNIHR